MAKRRVLSMEAGLAIIRCPVHAFWGISIERGDTGTRLTPSKCCGRWETIQQWRLTSAQWRDLRDEADNMAEAVAEAEEE